MDEIQKPQGAWSMVIDKAVAVGTAASVAMILGAVLVQVVGRYVLKVSFPWSEEAARYLAVWVTFLGAVLVTKRGGHFKIDVVVNLLPKRVQSFVSAVASIFVLTSLTLLLALSVKLTLSLVNQHSTAMEIPMWWVRLAIPVCSVLMIYYSLVEIANRVKRRRDS